MLNLFLSLQIVLALSLSDVFDLAKEPQFWALVVGPLTTLAVSVLKQPRLSRVWKRILAVVCSIVVGLVTVAAAGQVNFEDLLTTVIIVYGAAELAYRTLLKQAATRLEDATNRRPSEPALTEAEEYDEFYDF